MQADLAQSAAAMDAQEKISTQAEIEKLIHVSKALLREADQIAADASKFCDKPAWEPNPEDLVATLVEATKGDPDLQADSFFTSLCEVIQKKDYKQAATMMRSIQWPPTVDHPLAAEVLKRLMATS
jgi:hypothetical protein